MELPKPRANTRPDVPVDLRAQRGVGLPLILATVYATVLASLPLMKFQDRVNYRRYAENSLSMLEVTWGNDFLSFFANEPLWLTLNAAVGFVFPPEWTMRFIIFSSSFLFAFIFLRGNEHRLFLLALLLVLPFLLKNYITHLRQGVAIAIFMASLALTGKKRALMLSTPFVHASFFFVLGIYGVSRMVKLGRLSSGAGALVATVASVVLLFVAGAAASFFGARQADHYSFESTAGSGLGFLFWIGILALFALQGPSWLRKNGFATYALGFYLILYPITEIAARVFESALAVIILAGLGLADWRRYAFVTAILALGIYSWIVRLASEAPF